MICSSFPYFLAEAFCGFLLMPASPLATLLFLTVFFSTTMLLLGPRNCAANGDQVKLSVNLYNVQVLNSNLLSAHVTRHHLALHDTADQSKRP